MTSTWWTLPRTTRPGSTAVALATAGRVGVARSRESERAFLQTLVDDQKSVGIPEEQLDAIATTIAKNEEMTAQGIFLEHALDEMRETVKALAHIRRFACQQDAD